MKMVLVGRRYYFPLRAMSAAVVDVGDERPGVEALSAAGRWCGRGVGGARD